MISIVREQVDDIPLLHVAKESLHQQSNQPVVFFFHGLTSAKDQNLHIAYQLAQKGFRVILPDALHHGEREAGVTGMQRTILLWDIVMNSIQELDKLKDHFIARGLIDPSRIGVAGTSMGGITTYGALSQYEWIQSAVSLMGSAYYEHFATMQIEHIGRQGFQVPEVHVNETLAKLRTFDLSTQLHKLNGRPLMIWHGEADQVVPARYSTTLYNELLHDYEHFPERLALYTEKETGHAVSRKALFQLTDWFTSHLL
ncbi:esterase [Alkalihalobacillus sp. FSL W8-0930]